MKKVKVFAPGSIGNVGCGFDVFGLAIEAVGDTVEVRLNDTGKLNILAIEGDDGITHDPRENIVTVGVQALLTELQSSRGFDFSITKGVVAGSGMGSSGSSATAGVFAVNELLGRPFSRQQLLPFAAAGEQRASVQVHYDNVAPSMLGGFTVVRSTVPLEILQVAVPANLYLAIVRPGVIIKTGEAKRLLGTTMAVKDAVAQFGNIAGMVVGMQQEDIPLIGRSAEDLLAAPVRSQLIPKFAAARQEALAAGAAGFNISGSGPAMFAVCEGEATARKVLAAWRQLYADDNLAGFYLTRPDREGTRVIN